MNGIEIDEAVRIATDEDVAVLATLERDARAAVSEQRGGAALLAEQPGVSDWAPVVRATDRAVLVGTIDGLVVAYLELAYLGRAAVVRQVWVEPQARELGLGDGLVELASTLARARGCETIEGAALPGDRATKNLYERAGITARKIIVSKRL